MRVNAPVPGKGAIRIRYDRWSTDIAEMQQELASHIGHHASGNETHQTAISELAFIRSDRPLPLTHSIYEPSLCIIAQGSKNVILGSENYHYEPASYLIASVKLPITGQVVEATPERPYLSLRLQFRTDQIMDVAVRTEQEPAGRKAAGRGLQVHRIGAPMLEAVLRLVRLLDQEQDIPVLAPLFIREIVYRILQDEQGGASFRQFAMPGSQAGRIAEVVAYLRGPRPA